MERAAKRTRTGEGSDKPECTCFVGGLGTQINDASLKEFFSQYGEVSSARVIMDNTTNKTKGFGFVSFADANVAAELKKLSKLTMGDRQVDIGEPQAGAAKSQKVQINHPPVDPAAAKKLAQEASPEFRVFVGGLPRGADEAALSWFFSQFGVVQDFTIIQDSKTGLSKGYGFCTYADPSSAAMVKSFGNVEYMGKSMNVGSAMRGSKGPGPSASPQMGQMGAGGAAGGMMNVMMNSAMQGGMAGMPGMAGMAGMPGMAAGMAGFPPNMGVPGAPGAMGGGGPPNMAPIPPALNPTAAAAAALGNPALLGTGGLLPNVNPGVPPGMGVSLDMFNQGMGAVGGFAGGNPGFPDPSGSFNPANFNPAAALGMQTAPQGLAQPGIPGQWNGAPVAPMGMQGLQNPTGGVLSQIKTNTSFNVPMTMAGSIIGKGGVNLRDITNVTGAVVKFSKADDQSVPEGERRVDINGTQMQVMQAQEMLQSLLASLPSQQLEKLGGTMVKGKPVFGPDGEPVQQKPQDPGRTVFVGGLNNQATEQIVHNFFMHYGAIEHVKIIYNNQTGASKGFGFVTFLNESSATGVKQQKKIDMYGKMIDVGDPQRNKSWQEYDQKMAQKSA